MKTSAQLLAALQLSDSALPIGRFVHSHGVEAWLRERPEVSPATLAELIEATVSQVTAPLDGVVLAHAHAAQSLAELIELDGYLTARKLTPPARKASLTCGRQLAALSSQLAPEDKLVEEFARAVRDRTTDGNLAVVEGALGRACRLSAEQAVLVELRGTASALLSAAVRLGAISPAGAQGVLADLAPVLSAAAELALATALHDVSSTAPEIEIYSLAHQRADARMFAT